MIVARPNWSSLEAGNGQEREPFIGQMLTEPAGYSTNLLALTFLPPEHPYFLGPALKLSYFSPFLRKSITHPALCSFAQPCLFFENLKEPGQPLAPEKASNRSLAS